MSGRRASSSFLRLVHSVESRNDSEEVRAPSSAQGSFLPSSSPTTLIFLSWGKAALDDLLDIFELSKPKLIFDVRIAPRFDMQQLTRKRFFDLLREHNCQYVDLLGRLEVDSLNDALLNPELIAEQANKYTHALPNPNRGPFVFIHDDELIDDRYVSALAKALPTDPDSSWQVYRPLSNAEASSPKDVGERTASGVASPIPLVRQIIFISHATPEDNPFVIWLTSKLTAAGYEVWSDVTDLSGGDVFWGNIEETIRKRAAKVVFVQSAKVKEKAGTRKEVYLALKVGERNKITRFVVPMRIDGTPFDETFIELVDLQAIDCRTDWMSGFQSLLALLQRDGVPRSSTHNANQFSSLAMMIGRPPFDVVPGEEQVVENLLRIPAPPERLNFFSCSIQSNQLPDVAAQLQLPAFAYYTHIATTASADRLVAALSAIGYADVGVRERASLSWHDFLNANSGGLPSWKKGEARNYAYKMLNSAWVEYVTNRGAQLGKLANERPFWFFAAQHLPDNKVRFADFSGRMVRRQLVGFSKKRRVYWHFGVQARSLIASEKLYYCLSPHVTFSADGKTPLPSKAQLHSLRRSFCRSWWNDRWRDLLQAFVSAVGAGEPYISLDIGADVPLKVEANLAQATSRVILANAGENLPLRGFIADEEVEDNWEETFDEPEDDIADFTDGTLRDAE